MTRFRIVPIALLVCTAVLAVYLTLLGSGLLGQPLLDVKEVPAGQQEIAWLMPATSGTNWERFVAAVIHLREQWPKTFPHAPRLRARLANAFPEQTAEVPELALYMEGKESQKLLIRWYKFSSNYDMKNWLDKLARRSTPPLAIIGGDTSDRALETAIALEEMRKSWLGPAPLFLLTTATADRYFPDAIREENLTGDAFPKLIDVYRGRTFRFSFTNTRMANAVIDFVRTHPTVWSHEERDWSVLAAATLASNNAWGVVANLASKRLFNSVFLYTLAWSDDRYSLDLADRFRHVFANRYYGKDEHLRKINCDRDSIPYGVGDYFQPNPREADAAGLFLTRNRQFSNQNQLLVLPTGTQRARRFLRTLCRMAPREMDNVVVISGDSIVFNHVFRDRDLAWNILDMPVPLVFFSHRNPVDHEAGFCEQMKSKDVACHSGTQDVLLFSDLISAITQALLQDGRLLGNADEFEIRLRATLWRDGRVENPNFVKSSGGEPLFDDDGDRRDGTGEHVVWLKPLIASGRTMMQAIISVWHMEDDEWQLANPPLRVGYHSPVDPRLNAHAFE